MAAYAGMAGGCAVAGVGAWVPKKDGAGAGAPKSEDVDGDAVKAPLVLKAPPPKAEEPAVPGDVNEGNNGAEGDWAVEPNKPLPEEAGGGAGVPLLPKKELDDAVPKILVVEAGAAGVVPVVLAPGGAEDPKNEPVDGVPKAGACKAAVEL